MAAPAVRQQQQQQQLPQRRPATLTVSKPIDEWPPAEAVSPCRQPSSPLSGRPTTSSPSRGGSAPSRQQRTAAQHVAWAAADGPRGGRPASAGPAITGASGGGGGVRISGGSPNLNAAAAALAERQAMAEMVATLRPQWRNGSQPASSIGSSKRDLEALNEELLHTRTALAASQEQNRVLRGERRRLEEELGRCRTSLVKAEEMLNSRERSLSPNTGMSSMYRTSATTTLVGKLREQLAMQQSQTDSLRSQLDNIMRGTRATRMAELQAEVQAQEQELGRQAEMLGIMRRRMDEGEARAAEAIVRGFTAERLARMQVPLVVLQQAITASETRFTSTAASLDASATESPERYCNQANAARSGGASSAAAATSSGASPGGSSGGAEESGPPSPLLVVGPQSLSSGRIRKTMAVLGEAHRILTSQASLLAEIFPPGLTTEQLSIRAALRPATSGAPEVLRYLRHHIHRLMDLLASLPGNRLEYIREEEPIAGGRRNGRNGQRNARISNAGQARGSGFTTGRARSGGAAAGGSGAVGDEFDPWSLVGELLDFVRWLRGLDSKSVKSRPELEGGLEQLASVVGICDAETRRLLGTAASNGA